MLCTHCNKHYKAPSCMKGKLAHKTCPNYLFKVGKLAPIQPAPESQPVKAPARRKRGK